MNKTKEKKYSAPLIPGDYIIIVNQTGYEELNEYFQAKKGECMKELLLKKKTTPELAANAVDISNGSPMIGSLLKVYTALTNISYPLKADQ